MSEYQKVNVGSQGEVGHCRWLSWRGLCGFEQEGVRHQGVNAVRTVEAGCVQAPEIVGVKVYSGENIVQDSTILECDVKWNSALQE